MIITAQCYSDQGAIRPNNEDAIEYGIDHAHSFAWMVVADGMGGHQAGEVASETLVNAVARKIGQLKRNFAQDWQRWCEQTLKEANREIFALAEDHQSYQGMGTTAVLVIYWQDQCYLAWVGDSRCYRLRQGELVQQSRDHSMLQYLLDKGAISEQDAATSTAKNLLSRAVGIKPEVEVESRVFGLLRGDRLLLSTDGLHDFVPLANLADYARRGGDGEQIATELVKHAVSLGSKDNISYALLSVA